MLPHQIIKLPSHLGYADLSKIASTEKIKMCSTFLNSATYKTIEIYQKGNELINEAIRALQEIASNVPTDDSLALIENLKFVVESIKEYTSNIKVQTVKDTESSLLEKRLLILQDKYAIVHGRVLQSLKEARYYDEEAQMLFSYCMQQRDAT